MTTQRQEATLTAIGELAFEEEGSGSKPIFSYYRQANGHVTVDVVSEMEELHYRREGWTPMTEYGRFDMTAEYMANHPFEPLFMHGGAGEMPVDQVIENGFHINAPIVPGCKRVIDQNHPRHKAVCWSRRYVVNFPQLEGSGAQAWPCMFCSAVRPTKQGLDNHMEVMHKDERGEIRSSHVLAEAILKGLGGGNSTALVPATEEPSVTADAVAVLTKLASVGLNKAQMKVLADMGIELPQEASDGEGE